MIHMADQVVVPMEHITEYPTMHHIVVMVSNNHHTDIIVNSMIYPHLRLQLVTSLRQLHHQVVIHYCHHRQCRLLVAHMMNMVNSFNPFTVCPNEKNKTYMSKK